MSLWDDIKKFAQPYADDEDYDDYDDYDEYGDEGAAEGYENESASPYGAPKNDKPFGNTSAAAPAFTTGNAGTGFSGTVLNTASDKQQVVLTRPESFSDAPTIANNLRSKKAVVLNLEGVDKALSRRVVDFLSGCAYSLDGSVKKISQATYLFCPYNMEVQGDLKSLQSEVESYI